MPYMYREVYCSSQLDCTTSAFGSSAKKFEKKFYPSLHFCPNVCIWRQRCVMTTSPDHSSPKRRSWRRWPPEALALIQKNKTLRLSAKNFNPLQATTSARAGDSSTSMGSSAQALNPGGDSILA